MSERVFVYGTLRRGMFYYPEYMSNAEFVAGSKIEGFVMFKNPEDHYPYIIRGQGEIDGEVYKVSQEELDKLDILEEIPEVYTREKVSVLGEETWIYVFNSPSRPDSIRIESGDWVEYYKTSMNT